MGAISSSSGIETEIRTSGKRRRNFLAASPITSSAASDSLRIFASSSPIRVMESRFSTTRISHCASSRAFSRRVLCSSCVRSGLSRTADVEPTIEVRGVRRSWETARSRLPRIFSRSFSAKSLACRFAWAVRVQVIMETIRRVKKVSG